MHLFCKKQQQQQSFIHDGGRSEFKMGPVRLNNSPSAVSFAQALCAGGMTDDTSLVAFLFFF